MQLKKKWIAAPLVGLVALGSVFGGAALADSGGTNPGPKDQIIERAAGDLGVDAQALKDALAQARKDVMKEHMEARLAAAVEDGTITQEEADAIKAWMESRPDSLSKLKGKYGPRGFHGHRGFHGFGHGRFGMGPGIQQPSAPPATNSGLGL